MLTKLFPLLNPVVVKPAVPQRNCHLAARIESLHHAPVAASAQRAAPTNSEWESMLPPMVAHLIGQMSDRPLLGDRSAVTSPLWAIDPEDCWAEGTSRFYRFNTQTDAAGLYVLRSAFDRHRTGDHDVSLEGWS